MRTKLLRLTAILLFLTSSCHSGINISDKEINNSAMVSPQALNGIYSNQHINSSKNYFDPFWAHLKPFFKNEITLKYQQERPDLTFEIDVEDKGIIRFSLLEEEKVLASSKFKFDFLNNQIRIKRNSNLQGIPLIFYQHHGEVITLSLDKENDLIATFDGETSGGIFIFMFGTPIKATTKFKRI